MVKNIFIILSIITISVYTYAMEVENDITEMEVEIKPSPLLMLPLEIQNFVATFLLFNGEEEEQRFIERTAHKRKVLPEKCFDHIPSFTTFGPAVNTLSAYCPHNKTIALLIKLYNSGKSTRTLMLIDRYSNQKICDMPLNQGRISTIAISCNRDMFATIHHEEDCGCGATEVMDYKTILSIKNINTQKEKLHIIPDNFSFNTNSDYSTIAFNKQGTHIILYGNDMNKPCNNVSSPIQHHMIFPVTVIASSQSANNNLEKYFRQQGVCKDLVKQIASNK